MSNVITGEAAAQDEIRLWETEALTAKAAREVAERGCQTLRLELEALRGEHATLVSTVETLQGVATALAEEAKDLNGDVNMLRSALAEKTREHSHVQNLATKAESERDVARALVQGAQRDREMERQATSTWKGRLEVAQSERDTAREQLAASEAAREQMRAALMVAARSAHIATLDNSTACACPQCSQVRAALSASPSAVLAERESGLKARIAHLETALQEVVEIACRSAGGNTPEDVPEPANRDGEELHDVATQALAAPTGAWLAEHDAKVRAAALEPLRGIIQHQHCESCAAFVRALASTPSETKEPK